MDDKTKHINFPDTRGHFGQYGGKYVIETLMPALEELEKLYNKVNYLKKINNPTRSKPKMPTRRSTVDTKDEEDQKSKDKKEKSGNSFNPIKTTLKTLMMVQNINVSYSKNEGTNLPGFLDKPTYFGLDKGFSNNGIWK